MSVGILAVQGAFIEHAHCLEQLSQDYILLRKKSDIPKDLNYLILPGGESTVQRKLLHGETTDGFQTLPVTVRRNAYGRQLGSFSTEDTVGEFAHFPMRFIRAPYIETILHPDVQVLNQTDQHITAVKYQNQIGTAFHPELTNDLRIHQQFLAL